MQENNKPYHIQFIGPPGVGKTTIYNTLIKTLKNKYPTRESYIKQTPYNITDRTFDNEKTYQDLAALKLKSYQESSYSPIDKIKYTNWGRVMLTHNYIISKTNKNKIIISDENMLLSFSGELTEYLLKNETNACDFLKNHAAIFCYAPPEKIAKQIKQREIKTGRIAPYHKGLTIKN